MCLGRGKDLCHSSSQSIQICSILKAWYLFSSHFWISHILCGIQTLSFHRLHHAGSQFWRPLQRDPVLWFCTRRVCPPQSCCERRCLLSRRLGLACGHEKRMTSPEVSTKTSGPQTHASWPCALPPILYKSCTIFCYLPSRRFLENLANWGSSHEQEHTSFFDLSLSISLSLYELREVSSPIWLVKWTIVPKCLNHSSWTVC